MNEKDTKIRLLAELKGAIVGVFTVQGRSGGRFRHAGHCGISVLKVHWGKGVGSRLLEEGVAWAGANDNVVKLALKVHESNDRAIRLYEKFGFTVEGNLEKDIFLNGVYYDSLLKARLFIPKA
ncbi:MAG: GNAT family N-acetyltransferase [Planctomycetota bacterium]|jgi:RimJ/RimL family protein N-acetyltransferase